MPASSRHIKRVIFALLLASIPSSAFAQSSHRSGNDLLSECQDALKESVAIANLVTAGRCFGYLEGLNDSEGLKRRPSDSARTLDDPGLRQWCTPAGVTMGQIAMVIVKYLNDHPERLQEDKFDLARQALKRAWPCFNR
jgi:hypothetical protein